MTYNVFGGKLNLAQSINLIFSDSGECHPAPLWRLCNSVAVYKRRDLLLFVFACYRHVDYCKLSHFELIMSINFHMFFFPNRPQ